MCGYVYNNTHPEAEKTFLEILEKLYNECGKNQTRGNDLTPICDILYSEFNDYYLAWVTEQGLKPPQAGSICHFFNYFLENSAAGEKLEEIIWEISSHIINSRVPEDKGVIENKIMQAKKMI